LGKYIASGIIFAWRANSSVGTIAESPAVLTQFFTLVENILERFSRDDKPCRSLPDQILEVRERLRREQIYPPVDILVKFFIAWSEKK